jgi:ribosomal protein S18 acetylase RimI-like enzyme
VRIEVPNAIVAIRNLDQTDIGPVTELGRLVFDWPSERVLWSEEVVLWYYEKARVVSFVAECDQMVVGFILCFAAESTGCIEWIGVDDRFRRRGIASRLVHRALLTFRAGRVRKIVSLAREDGKADRLFQQSGFCSRDLRKLELVIDPSVSVQ